MGSIKGQKHNPYIEGKYAFVNKNDVVFTPDWLAEKICSMFPIMGKVLEPCKGEGAFMRYLPEGTDWCEITEGRNYYDYNEKVDWIVTNPPYSDYNRFLEHSFELADNIVLLVPVAKMMKSMGTLKSIFKYGGIVSCHFLSGGQAGFPFGFPIGIYYLKRNYKGQTNFNLLTNSSTLEGEQSEHLSPNKENEISLNDIKDLDFTETCDYVNSNLKPLPNKENK